MKNENDGLVRAERFELNSDPDRPMFLPGQHHYRYLAALRSAGVPNEQIGKVMSTVISEEAAIQLERMLQRMVGMHRHALRSVANLLDLPCSATSGFERLVDSGHRVLEDMRHG